MPSKHIAVLRGWRLKQTRGRCRQSWHRLCCPAEAGRPAARLARRSYLPAASLPRGLLQSIKKSSRAGGGTPNSKQVSPMGAFPLRKQAVMLRWVKTRVRQQQAVASWSADLARAQFTPAQRHLQPLGGQVMLATGHRETKPLFFQNISVSINTPFPSEGTAGC